MQANLYATFRLLAGVKTIPLELPEGTTIEQAVNAVMADLPVLRPHWVDASGELHAHVNIFVDGEDFRTLSLGIDAPLKADSVLDFFPPVGGGA